MNCVKERGGGGKRGREGGELRGGVAAFIGSGMEMYNSALLPISAFRAAQGEVILLINRVDLRCGTAAPLICLHSQLLKLLPALAGLPW